MDASGLFTVLGIFVAIITLISEEWRRDFFLRSSLIYWLFFGTLILISLAIMYSNIIIELFGITPLQYKFGFDEETLVLTLVLFMSFLFIYKLFGKRVPSQKVKAWVDVSDELLRKKKYNILGFMLEKYQNQFLKRINKQTYYEKIYNYISRNSRKDIKELLTYSPVKVGKIRNIKFYIFKKILRLLPYEVGSKPLIRNSIVKLLKSNGFIDYLIEVYPSVPTVFISSSHILQEDEIIDNFFKKLIADRNCLLYRELRDNQHFMYSTGYRIEPDNFMLTFYFSDANEAIKHMIWKPIGDYVCNYIKKQKGSENFYNEYSESFSYTDEQWKCPIFVGVQFFDIMVKSAIYQKLNDHMWLMYYEYFLNEILKNIDRSKNSEVWQEFPLKFDYLIYNIISNCCDWVSASEYIYKNASKNLENIESASECLGRMIRKLLSSEKFDESKKTYYLEIILKLMRDLDSKGNERLSKKIFNSIVGVDMFNSRDSNLTWLNDVYREVDHVLRLSGSTFDTEINKAP